MFADRRKAERRPCRGNAKIVLGVGSIPRDCLIVDISDGGVRIIAENLDVPEEFALAFPAGRPRRCRLAWRIGCEFGAEFIEHLVVAPASRPQPAGNAREHEDAA